MIEVNDIEKNGFEQNDIEDNNVEENTSEAIENTENIEISNSESKIEYDKPFKTYDEQISIMQSRNILISDVSFTKNALSDISYYTLINGYKSVFPMDNDKFIYPVKFDELYMLYYIDNSLNNILLKYIIHIERSLKTKIAYRISQKYGVMTDLNDLSNTNEDDYLFRDNYLGNKFRNNVLESIKNRIKDSKNLSVQHYRKNHNHLPCWILMNDIPFGLSIKFYQILKSDDKEYICNEFITSDILTIEEKKEFLTNSLNILKEYRNGIAHGNKIFSSTIKQQLPKRSVLKLSNGCVSLSDYKNGIGKNDLFAVIIIIIFLTRDSTKDFFFNEINSFLLNYGRYDYNGKNLYELLSLPNNLINRLMKLK